jgi:pyruvate,water dikinase
MTVRALAEVTADDVGVVGGKAASLGELTAAGFPVPPGFVVTASAYREALSAAGVEGRLGSLLDVDPDDPDAVSAAAEQARDIVREVPLPVELREGILATYDGLADETGSGDGDPPVAVRSSATAEDLPDASFAGQQETYLNVTGDDLLDRVRDCWASAFTDRAVEYRNRKGFDHAAVDVAVVVQLMVDAERSGVMFTADPTTGDSTVTVEAAWGLGEAVVSGLVSPDNYVLDPDTEALESVSVATKGVMCVRDAETGETVERPVPDEKRTARVLSDDRLWELADLGQRIEAHYGTPQDVEWAIAGGELYVLQSRPITTIPGADADEGGERRDRAESPETTDTAGPMPTSTDGSGEATDVAAEEAENGHSSDADGSPGQVLVSGHAASPGVGAGVVRLVTDLDDLSRVNAGDVVVAESTTPDMVSAMSRASGIVTDEGGITSHAAIVARELGVPAVVGTGDATRTLDDGQVVTVDGDRGTVRAGGVPSGSSDADASADTESADTTTGGPPRSGQSSGGTAHATSNGTDARSAPPGDGMGPTTATGVKVNISMPEAAERAAATGADGVGLVRIEHLVTSLGSTPERFVADNSEAAYVDELVEGIRTIADAFYPRPVRVRTLDAPTDEFRRLTGGDDEPVEDNPMLGYRGIRRSLDQPELFRTELTAFRRLYEEGYDNVEIMFPLVTDGEDARRAREHLEAVGIDPARRSWGAMIETPAAAMSAASLCDAGVDFVSFGTNDLTQYVLAVDRNNEHVAERYDALHPAVTQLMGEALDVCRERDVMTSICGQAGSDPRMVRFLVEQGVSSVSANPDAVRAVRQEVARVERRLLLDSVR